MENILQVILKCLPKPQGQEVALILGGLPIKSFDAQGLTHSQMEFEQGHNQPHCKPSQ